MDKKWTGWTQVQSKLKSNTPFQTPHDTLSKALSNKQVPFRQVNVSGKGSNTPTSQILAISKNLSTAMSKAQDDIENKNKAEKEQISDK